MRKMLASLMMLAMILSFAGPAHAKKAVSKAHKKHVKAQSKTQKTPAKKTKTPDAPKAPDEAKPVQAADSPVIVTPVPAGDAAAKE